MAESLQMAKLLIWEAHKAGQRAKTKGFVANSQEAA